MKSTIALLLVLAACGGSSQSPLAGTWSMQLAPTGGAPLSGRLELAGPDSALTGSWSAGTMGGSVTGRYVSTPTSTDEGLHATLTCTDGATGLPCQRWYVDAAFVPHQPQGDVLTGCLVADANVVYCLNPMGGFDAKR